MIYLVEAEDWSETGWPKHIADGIVTKWHSKGFGFPNCQVIGTEERVNPTDQSVGGDSIHFA